SRPLPGNRRRTITSAQTIPKTVLIGTAIAVMRSVSLKAWMVSGSVSASHAGAKPCSNVRQKTTASGPTRITMRYTSATDRNPSLRRCGLRTLVPRREVADCPDREQEDEREREEHDGDACRRRRVPALDAAEHIDGGHLRLEGEVAGDDHERSE